MEHFNRSTAIDKGAIFIDRGWEETPPGVGRGQTQINELLAPCDYVIVLLSDRWGSPPGGDAYTSGTEEEFHTAVSLLAKADASMRDIHVYFQSLPADRLADPGEELKKVIEFKTKLQECHGILYSQFDSIENLKVKIDGSLRKWVEPLEIKIPITISFSPAPSVVQEQGTSLLERAVAHASDGMVVQAEVLFAQACRDDDPSALLEYARFSRRRGLLEDAIKLNERVIRAISLRQDQTAIETANLMDALSNIGVIERKQGNLNKSIDSLEEAIRVGDNSPHMLHESLAYALDNLGHSLNQVDHHDRAFKCFETSLEYRRTTGSPADILQSELNIAWQSLRVGQARQALKGFENHLSEARRSGQHALANCLAGLGNALLDLRRPKDAVAPLVESLDLNRVLKNSDGIGIASGLLARARASLGDSEGAAEALEDTLEQSEASGNVVGLATAKWAQALDAASKGELRHARSLLEKSIELAERTGNVALFATISQTVLEGDTSD